jgi:HTH-type transcriptional regulator / antitoxin HigA
MAAEVRPIRTKRDYETALKEAEHLGVRRPETPDGDRLDVLGTLIDAYETEHHPMDPPDPIEAIKFRVEQQGLTRRDLEEIIGTRTRIAEVLGPKRGLSIAMIRRLDERLGISAEVLIRPSRRVAQPLCEAAAWFSHLPKRRTAGLRERCTFPSSQPSVCKAFRGSTRLPEPG